MIPFGELNQRQQTIAMRKVAVEALPHFGLEGSDLSLVTHAFNTTFRVRHASGNYALRVNVNSNRDQEAIAWEIAWTEALARDGQLYVPMPRRTLGSEPSVTITSPHFAEPRPVVCFQWLEGRTPSRKPSPGLTMRMGYALRQLQDHASKFTFPPGSARPLLESVLDGRDWRLPDAHFRPAWERADAALERCKLTEPPRVTHFDLHFWNVKLAGPRLAVFDFDDSLMGWPMADVAQTMFYIRRMPKAEALEAAFWKGFGSVPSDYGLATGDFEDLVMGRSLLLANDLVNNQTASIAAVAQSYVRLVRSWLVEYEKGGPFRPVGNLKDFAEDQN